MKNILLLKQHIIYLHIASLRIYKMQKYSILKDVITLKLLFINLESQRFATYPHFFFFVIRHIHLIIFLYNEK